MPNHLIAWHGDQAEEYFAKLALATPADVQAAEASFGTKIGNDQPIFSISGDKAIINISGPLTKVGPNALAKYYGFGGTGYDEIIQAVDEIKKAGVKETVIHADSGGGMVDGCDRAYNALLSLSEGGKLTFINKGMIASAMYWLACAGDEILADSISCFTGSIGVKIAAYDFSEYYAKFGITERVMVSENASKKSPSISDEKGRALLTEQLNAIERIFHLRVSEGRGVTIEDIKSKFGQGSVMVAFDPGVDMPSALSNGLIDGIIGFTNDKKQKKHKTKTVALAESVSVSDILVAGDVQNKGETSALIEDSKIESGSVPAQKMVIKMAKIKDIIASDPEAGADFAAEIAQATKEALASASLEVSRKGQIAKMALCAEKNYPASIRDLAVGLIAGENTESELKAAMSSVDAVRQEMASNKAVAESAALEKTGGENLDKNSADEDEKGVTASESAYQSRIARIRAKSGMGV